jgi:predicted alpha/beta hydrolase family esterase
MPSLAPPCLTIPGLHGSGPDHWQSRWERERADCHRVDLGSWEDPDRSSWVSALGRAIDRSAGFPILVGHSLGCLAIVWWASTAGLAAAKVAGALLVAPPDVERDGADPRLVRFGPVPRRPMPFPTIVVASHDDPYASFQRSREMAAGWSARLHDAGTAGHLNALSNLGDWRDGQALVALLAEEASAPWRRPVMRRSAGR